VDNPAQQARIDRLAPLLEQRRALVDRLIEQRTRGASASDPAAQQLVREGMDVGHSVGALAAEIEQHEHALLGQRVAAAERAERRTRATLLYGSMASLSIMLARLDAAATAIYQRRSRSAAPGLSEPARERSEVHTDARRGSHPGVCGRAGRRAHRRRQGQRRGIRPCVQRQAVRRVPAPAQRHGLRRHRRGPSRCSTKARPSTSACRRRIRPSTRCPPRARWPRGACRPTRANSRLCSHWMSTGAARQIGRECAIDDDLVTHGRLGVT
jgi:hypothetical protein